MLFFFYSGSESVSPPGTPNFLIDNDDNFLIDNDNDFLTDNG
jgi:hypothetical protein